MTQEEPPHIGGQRRKRAYELGLSERDWSLLETLGIRLPVRAERLTGHFLFASEGRSNIWRALEAAGQIAQGAARSRTVQARIRPGWQSRPGTDEEISNDDEVAPDDWTLLDASGVPLARLYKGTGRRPVGWPIV